MVIYLSGPMTGLPDWNYPAFHTWAAVLRNAGHTVANPAENFGGDPHAGPRAMFMRKDIAMLLNAEAVAVLPGWERSKGATLEVAIARELDLPVLDIRTMEPYHETVLEEAQRLIYGDRQASYGHPIEDFTRTGRMWGAILGVPDVPPEKVGLCMVALKISRECHRPKRDNLVDGAGYFGTVAMIRERQAV